MYRWNNLTQYKRSQSNQITLLNLMQNEAPSAVTWRRNENLLVKHTTRMRMSGLFVLEIGRMERILSKKLKL